MFKAKRLFAAMLVVIMALTMVTFSAFAADTKVFSKDYTSPEVPEGSAVVKSSAVLVSDKAKGRAKGSKITELWDGENYVFVVGENAFSFNDIKAAQSQADVNADGELPQLLIAPGTYNKIEVTSSVQIFGYHWNTNPNEKDESDISKQWTLNKDWNNNVTRIKDVVISASASGIIDIYGIEIAHRFSDAYRKVSAIKTTLTLRNIHFNQTDASANTLPAGADGRTLTKCAMSFWNYNSANTSAATATQNIDETYLVNFRLGRLNMDGGGDNRFIDEICTPTMVFDGFCADYKTSSGGEVFDCNQMFWMKWRDALSNTKCVVKNSFFTAGVSNGSSTDKFDFDFEGFYNNKIVDVKKGESAELIFENNIFSDHYMANGNSNIRIYQSEYSKISYKNNTFINTKGGSPALANWSSLSGADLSDNMEFIDNDFLGYSPLIFSFGSDSTKIDVTGTYVNATYSKDYKSQQSDILPTGNIRYDYCYIDGARTISTKVIQEVSMDESVVIDDEAMTMSLVAEDGFYYNTVKATSKLGAYEIYESDKDFSNYNDFSKSNRVVTCVLKNAENYFLFVWYSPDKSDYEVYRLTVSRPEPEVLALTGFDANPAATIDGVKVFANLDKDSDSLTFTPHSEEGTTFKVNDLATGEVIKADSENASTFTISGIERGQTKEYRLEIAKGYDRQYYTIVATRPYNTECELISIDDRLVVDGDVITANVDKNATEFEFDVQVSDDARAIVWSGSTVFTMIDGKIKITDLSISEYKFAVVAEDGITSKDYTLKINKIKSAENAILSIAGATATDTGYAVTVADSFTVNATVSPLATYAVYSDAACTAKIEGNVVLAGTTAYIVVTAENGTVAPAVKITVAKTAPEADKPATEIKDSSKVFTDVKAKWYKNAVDYNYSHGFISGVSENEFGVGTTITRGMFITVLARIAGVDTKGAANKVETKFTDVKSGKYYTAAIKWASDNGIVGGITDTTFAPDNAIERQQLCTMLVKFAKVINVDLKASTAEIAFKDASSVQKYAKDAVKVCQMAEIVSGYKVEGGNEFRPTNTATREEAAQILYGFHSKFVK